MKNWSPESDMADLNECADTLHPAELKAKMIGLADAGKVCACGVNNNCFGMVYKVPKMLVSQSGVSGQYCGITSSETGDK